MNEISILVLTEDYPDNEGKVSLNYVHTRNIHYQADGIKVDNLSFSAKESYTIDGIKVLSLRDYEQTDRKYDLLLLHAANLRHHYKFLKSYGNRFMHFIFFFHGHEVMRINKDYCKPYDYMKRNLLIECAQNLYDVFKLCVWRRFFFKNAGKCSFVFVSEWMKAVFEKNIGNDLTSKVNCYITYNSVGQVFEIQSFNDNEEKLFDFITIRSNLDGSKYAVDIVNKIAQDTPDGRFLIVGKGELFNHIEKADNILWLNKTLNHAAIIEYLNQSRYALMPTRTDAQGLMMCEMAAFGIPVITSDIPVCHEVFDGFENAFFISNSELVSLNSFLDQESKCIKDSRYNCDKTTKTEINMIREIYERL